MCHPVRPSSHAMRRILSALESHGPMLAADIARVACVALSTLTGGGYLRILRNLGLIHVAGYLRRPGGGTHRKVWAVGAGVDAVPLPRLSEAIRSKAYREKVRVLFGPDVAARILKSRRNGGADRIVRDGVVLYARRARNALA